MKRGFLEVFISIFICGLHEEGNCKLPIKTVLFTGKLKLATIYRYTRMIKSNNMSKDLRIVLTVYFMIFFMSFAKAQKDQNQQFLQKVGVLDSLYSTVLDESRKIYVQLPASYSPERKQAYPVVYVLDGEVFLPIVHAVHNLYSGGFIPEMVMVGISNEVHRVRDLTTSPISSKYGMPFREENGKADNFRTFMETELIPFVEGKYPVTNHRTLIGHSYGGLFTVATLLSQPDLFANYLAIDPSLDWDNQKLVNDSEKILATQQYTNKGLFMSLSGQLHMQNSQITIDNVMEDTTDFTVFPRANIAFSNMVNENAKNGLAFEWKFYPRDIHGTIPLPSIMDGLISLFQWYQMENTDRFNSFDTPKEELLSIIRYREEKLKEHFGYSEPPYPEELLTMLGHMNMDMQQTGKAQMYFELATEYYPWSADAHGSMAEYYAAQGDFAAAIKYVTKAFELSGDDRYEERINELKSK